MLMTMKDDTMQFIDQSQLLMKLQNMQQQRDEEADQNQELHMQMQQIQQNQ